MELVTLLSAGQRFTNEVSPYMVSAVRSTAKERQKATQKITFSLLFFTYGNCKSVHLDWLFTHKLTVFAS